MSTCLVSDADYRRYWPQRGDRVWFVGKRSRSPNRKHGIVIRIDDQHATVRLDEWCTAVMSVEVSRLHKEDL